VSLDGRAARPVRRVARRHRPCEAVAITLELRLARLKGLGKKPDVILHLLLRHRYQRHPPWMRPEAHPGMPKFIGL